MCKKYWSLRNIDFTPGDNSPVGILENEPSDYRNLHGKMNSRARVHGIVGQSAAALRLHIIFIKNFSLLRSYAIKRKEVAMCLCSRAFGTARRFCRQTLFLSLSVYVSRLSAVDIKIVYSNVPCISSSSSRKARRKCDWNQYIDRRKWAISVLIWWNKKIQLAVLCLPKNYFSTRRENVVLEISLPCMWILLGVGFT